MDEFSWGNTRVVIGEGKDKKVITNEEEKFDDSMIPVKSSAARTSFRLIYSFLFMMRTEYEAEAWETGTRHSDDTGYDSKPRSRSHTRSRPASPHTANYHGGDYYRDTNMIHSNNSVANLRTGGSQLSHSNLSLHAGMPPAMPFHAPQLPVMPFGGSISGSEHGHMMPMPMAYQNTGSMYGMPMLNPMTGMNMNMNMNMFGGGGGVSPVGSQIAAVPPSVPPLGLGGGHRPISTFSMATSVGLFGPSNSTNPSDEELFNALRNYLSTQDLMTVTKK
jgi:chitin synthase